MEQDWLDWRASSPHPRPRSRAPTQPTHLFPLLPPPTLFSPFRGQGDSGQLGVSSTNITTRTTPTPLDAAYQFSQICTGFVHTCGIMLDDGTTKCWGSNNFGQLGIGSTTFSNIPAAVDPGHLFVQLACGDYHT